MTNDIGGEERAAPATDCTSKEFGAVCTWSLGEPWRIYRNHGCTYYVVRRTLLQLRRLKFAEPRRAAALASPRMGVGLRRTRHWISITLKTRRSHSLKIVSRPEDSVVYMATAQNNYTGFADVGRWAENEMGARAAPINYFSYSRVSLQSVIRACRPCRLQYEAR